MHIWMFDTRAMDWVKEKIVAWDRAFYATMWNLLSKKKKQSQQNAFGIYFHWLLRTQRTRNAHVLLICSVRLPYFAMAMSNDFVSFGFQL